VLAVACASAVVHVGHTLLLVRAYGAGDLNQTYPLARGLGPVIVAVFAAVVLDERLPVGAMAGVVRSSAVWRPSAGRRGGRSRRVGRR
jgi:uncharacterized membrane protein